MNVAIIYFIYVPLRFCLYLLSRLLFVFIPAEKKKYFEQSLPMVKNSRPASKCFIISSEGELEQLMPLIEKETGNEKGIQIIYSSFSVEKRIHDLFSSFDNVDLWRAPLASMLPWTSELTAFFNSEELIMCRYDLYPEYYYLVAKNNVTLSIYQAALKKKSLMNPWYCYWVQFYKLADKIIPATQKDFEGLQELFQDKVLKPQDLRILQIQKRQRELKKLNEFPKGLAKLQDCKKILIFGSAYPSDIPLIEFFEENSEFTILIAPHELKDLASWKEKLQKIGLNTSIKLFSEWSLNQREARIVIVDIRGLLCELYYFSHFSYVGGGFGHSVHSLLEPWVAGNFVFCGPQVMRSREKELIREACEQNEELVDITIVNTLKDGDNLLKRMELFDYQAFKLALKQWLKTAEL